MRLLLPLGLAALAAFPALAQEATEPAAEAGEPPPGDPGSPGAVVDPTAEIARNAFTEGQAAFEAADFPRAAAQFEVAYQIVGSPEIAFNIGICYERTGDRERAADWYGKYLAGNPEAPDRADIEAHIVELTGPAEEEEAQHALLPHRLRLNLGWGITMNGVWDKSTAACTSDCPAGSPQGTWLQLGYQYVLYKGLMLDVMLGGTFVTDPPFRDPDIDVYSLGLGLGYAWTHLPYVILGLRGDITFYIFNRTGWDLWYFIPARLGVWLEVPIVDWFAVHVDAGFGAGGYVGSRTVAWGILGEVGVGLTFAIPEAMAVAEQTIDEIEDDTGGPPAPHYVPPDTLDRSWQ